MIVLKNSFFNGPWEHWTVFTRTPKGSNMYLSVLFFLPETLQRSKKKKYIIKIATYHFKMLPKCSLNTPLNFSNAPLNCFVKHFIKIVFPMKKSNPIPVSLPFLKFRSPADRAGGNRVRSVSRRTQALQPAGFPYGLIFGLIFGFKGVRGAAYDFG